MAERKRTTPLDWEDIRYFVELARCGSLSATARALGVNHATVSRRLARLEATLAHPLFERRPEGYALNAEGSAALASALRMEEAALALPTRFERHPGLAGSVRLTTVRGFAEHFLVPRLGELHRRHPAITVVIEAESRNLSLARREADLALRLGRSRDGNLLARRLGSMGYRFFAAPDYLARPASLAAPSFIGFDEGSAGVPEAGWMARHASGRPFAFRSNSQMAQLSAARAGFGIALLPCFLVAVNPGLVPVPGEDARYQREIWLLMRRDLARVPRIRAVADHLAELIEGARDLLAGE
jgi:DNA-binding transcriptional LysR family regulator